MARRNKNDMYFEPGTRFGRLTVQEVAERLPSGIVMACRCDCGNEVAVVRSSLKTGTTRCCGCGEKQ